MSYKAIFFRGEMMGIKEIPDLTFRGHVLRPFDTYAAGNLRVLYFTPDTKLPDIEALNDQLEMRGFVLVGKPQTDDGGNVVVRCRKIEA